jgi:hypothetical protein
MEIGKCIAAWARVDDELFQVFRHCVGPLEQSAIIYYRTPGLETRLALTDELVESVLPKRERKSGGHDPLEVGAWKNACASFRTLLATRQRIAHHPVAVRQEPFRAAMPVGRTPSWYEIYVRGNGQLRSRSQGLPALRK